MINKTSVIFNNIKTKHFIYSFILFIITALASCGVAKVEPTVDIFYNVTFNQNKPDNLPASLTIQDFPNPSVETIKRGNSVLKPSVNPKLLGHTFVGWSKLPSSNVNFNFNTNILEDTNIYAIWEKIPVSEINITPPYEVLIGTDYTLTATVQPADALQSVTWSIDGIPPSGVSLVNGVIITTIGTTKPGAISVRATSIVDRTKNKTQTITLNYPQPTSVTITSADTTKIGVDLTLTATVQPANALQSVTWSVNGNPNGVSITNGVLKTVGGIATPGTITVTATSTVDNTKANSQTITLEQSTAPAPTSVTITSADTTKIGVDLALTATVQPADALQTVTWSVNGNPNGVSIINGVLKTVGGIATPGTITVTATSTVDNTKANSQTITLEQSTAPAPTSVTITSADTTKIGVDLTLTATVQPADALQSVTWSVNGNPNGVSITNGVLKTVGGIATPGTITVTATSTVDNTKANSQTITLEQSTASAPTSVTITSADTTKIGIDLALTATVQPADALQSVTWSVNGNPNGVSITNGVLKTVGGIATPGTITVTATSTVDNTKANSQTITLEQSTAPAPTSVTITSADTTKIGVDLTLTATVLPADALQSVTWSVNGNPNGVSITNGVLKTVGGIATPGTITVTATSTVDNTKSNSQTITLEQSTASAPTSVTITSADTTKIGVDLTLTATVLPADALQTVIWSVNGNPNGVSITNGVLKTVGGIATPGTITVTATSTVDNTKSNSQTITLEQSTASAPTSVTITSADTTKIGIDLALTATVQPADALQSVTWSVNGNPNGVSITNGVLKTVGGIATPGTITVTATSTVDNTKANSQTITLEQSTASAPTSVTITSADTTKIGIDLALTATVLPADALQSVTWSVNGNPNGVSITNGVLKTVGGIATPGTITVTATSTVDNTKANSQTITLEQSTAPAPTSVTITSADTTKIGVDLTLTATVQPADALQTVTWSVNGNPNGVSIANGVLKTVRGIATPGTITVTATSTVDNTKANSQTITLEQSTASAPTSVTITSADTTKIGIDLALTATVQPADALQSVTWSVNGNPNGVSITNGVLKTVGGIATPGTITVTATSTVDNTKANSQTITLEQSTASAPTSVTITSADTTKIGIDLALTATVQPADALQSVTWSVNGNPNGVSITNGVLKTVGGIATPGTITVTATSTVDNTKSNSQTITLEQSTASAPTSVTITSADTTKIGIDLALTATVQPADALQSVTWSVNGNPNGVSITNGVLKTVGGIATPGTITVTATSTVDNTKSNSQTITLEQSTASAPTSVTITSADTTKIGIDLALTATVQPADALQSVTWSVNGNPNGVSITNGVLKTVGGIATPGTITVTATSTVDNTKANSQTITLEQSTAPAPTSVTITSADTTKIGVDLTLTATVLPADALQTVTWSVNGNPNGVSITNGVLKTVGGIATPGTITVTATSTVDNTKSNSQTITLEQSTASAPTSVTITSADTTKIGVDLTLTATVQPADALQSVTWSVNGNPNGVSITNGVLKTVGGIATPGTITVTATSTVDNTKSNSQTITLEQSTASAPTSVTITSADTTKIGIDLALTATVQPADALQSVTWSVNGNPNGVSITNGVLKTVGGIATPGTITVTATSTVDNTKSNSQTITLEQSTASAPTSVTITSADTTKIGVDLTLTATVQPADALQSVTWSVNGNPNGVSITNGVLKTVGGIATPGTITVTATSTVDNTKSNSQTITLEQSTASAPTSVTITSADTTKIGIDLVLTATVLPADALQSVTWSVNGNPNGVSITNGVLKTVGGIATPGTITVTATSTVDSTKANSQTITLEQSTASAPTSVTITSADTTKIGVDLTLTATVLPADALQSVTWSVNGNPNGVSITNGVLKTVGGIATPGTITVTATSTVDSTKANSQTITLEQSTASAPTSVTITSADTTKIGIDLALTATVQPADALQSVTWSVNGNPNGVSITNGVLKTVGGIATPGTITVTATSTVDNTKSNSQTITLEQSTASAPTSVTITSADTTKIGVDLTLTATVQPADALQSVTWSVNGNPNGVSITNGVLKTVGGIATPGTITVTATSTVDNTKANSQTITLEQSTASAPTSVTITSADTTKIGIDLALTATVQPADALQSVTWSVNGNPNGVSITNGVLKTVGGIATPGTITVTATSTVDSTKSNSQTITLEQSTASAPTSVTITSADTTKIGIDLALTATVLPADALQSVTWSVNGNPNGVSITNGVLKTVGGIATPGTITVTATSTVDNTKSNSQTITLEQSTASAPTSVTITSADTTKIGVDLTLTATVQPADALQTVIWSVNGNPNGVSITNGVLKTVGGIATPGTITVTATSTVDNTKANSQTITLEQSTASAPTSVTITSADTTKIGVDLTLTATVQPADALQTVTWSVNGNPNGVSITNGVLKTVRGIATPGTITVTATSTVDNTKANSQTVILVATNQFKVTYFKNKPDGVTENVENFPNPDYVLVIARGLLVELPTTPTLKSYTFSGWKRGTSASTLEANNFNFSTPVTEEIKLYATWTPVPSDRIKVTFIVNKPSDVAEVVENFPNPNYVLVLPSGTAIEPTKKPSIPRYTFNGWKKGTSASALETMNYNFSTPVTEEIKLYATWTPIPPNQFKVTYFENKPDGVTENVENFPNPDYVLITSGGTATEPAKNPTLPSFTFNGWKKGTSSTNIEANNFNFSTPVTEEIKLYATWSPVPPNQFKVTFFENKPNGITENAENFPNPDYVLITSGGTATEPAKNPTLPSFTFNGWKKGTSSTNIEANNFNFSTPVTEEIKLYATWSPVPPNQFKVTFFENKPNGITENAENFPNPDYVLVNSGKTVSVPVEEPTIPRHIFTGWKMGTSSTNIEANNFNFSTAITQETKLYATWSPVPANQFKITFFENKPDGVTENVGNFPNPYYQLVDQGTVISPAPTNPSLARHTFEGWKKGTSPSNLESDDFNFSTVINEEIKLYATWSPVPVVLVQVRFVENKPNGVAENIENFPKTKERTIESNQRISKPAPSPSLNGYTFSGWRTGTSNTSPAFDFNTRIVVETTIYATWTAVPLGRFKVTFVENKPNGVTENIENFPDPHEVLVIESIMRVSKPEKTPTLVGYLFSGWKSSASSTSADFNFANHVVSSDTMIYATWTLVPANQFKVTYFENIPDGVSDKVQGFPQKEQIVMSGSTISTPSTPSLSGYSFDGWKRGTSPTAIENTNFLFSTQITQETRIYATWKPLPSGSVIVTFVENKPTGVSEAVESFPEPRQIAVEEGKIGAVSKPIEIPLLKGYIFAGWRVGQDYSSIEFSFTNRVVRAPGVTIYASWKVIPQGSFSVTYLENLPNEMNLNLINFPSPAGLVVTAGETVNEPILPSLKGYTFNGWKIEASSTSAAYNFGTAILQNTNIYASWTKTADDKTKIIFKKHKPDGVVASITNFPNPLEMLVTKGTQASEPVSPSLQGYSFAGWVKSTFASSIDINILSLPFFRFNEVINEEIILFPKWIRVENGKFKVTFFENKPDGVTASVNNFPNPREFILTSGETIANTINTIAKIPQNPSLNNYTFNGWYAGNSPNDLETNTFDFENTTITKETKIYATWTVVPTGYLKITFVENKPLGSTDNIVDFPNPKEITIMNGRLIPEPRQTPSLPSYTFKGWYRVVNMLFDTSPFDFTSTYVNQETVIYARWDAIPSGSHKVTYFENKPVGETKNIIGFPNPREILVSNGQSLVKPTNPTLSGYIFDGWRYNAQRLELNFPYDVRFELNIYATWLATYTINFHANKPADAPADASVTGVFSNTLYVGSGKKTNTPAIPQLEGYVFDGWYAGTDSNNLESVKFDFTTRTITQNFELFATWKKLYLVTYNGNKPADAPTGINVQGLPSVPENVPQGQMATRPQNNPTLEGYTFNGWYAGTNRNNLESNEFDFVSRTITNNINIYATWNSAFIVTYNGNIPGDAPTGISVQGLPSTPENVPQGQMATRPQNDPTLSGYAFNGWYAGTDSNNLESVKFDFTTRTITQNFELFATWKKLYLVTYNGNKPTDAPAGINVQGLPSIPDNVPQGQMATRPQNNPTLEGYQFVGWFGSTIIPGTNSVRLDDTEFNFQTTPINTNTVIYAKWTVITHTVTYFGNKPTSAAAVDVVQNVPSSVTVKYGTSTPPPNQNPTLTAYAFASWHKGTDENNIEPFRYIFNQPVKENIRLYAKWNPAFVKVTYAGLLPNGAPTSSTITGLPTNLEVSVNYNGIVSAPSTVPTLNGYIFQGWFAGTNPNTLEDSPFGFETRKITSDINLYTKWKVKTANTYTVTFIGVNPDNTAIEITGNQLLGLAFPNPQTVNDGDIITRPPGVKIAGDYYFSDWYSDKDAYRTFFDFNNPIDKDTVIYARFHKKTKVLTKLHLKSFLDNHLPEFFANGNYKPNLNYFDVSSLNDLSFLFRPERVNGVIGTSKFNGDISEWNVEGVTDMRSMFVNNVEFNGDISEWNTNSLVFMDSMFERASAFNQDINSWNVSKVTSMQYTFSGATAFNTPLSSWNVEKVDDTSYMFYSATNFNQDLSNWRLKSINSMGSMFEKATAFKQNLNNWNIPESVSRSDTFKDSGLELDTSLSLPAWAQ